MTLRPQVHPLDEFYLRASRPLLGFAEVPAADMPEPARSLLIHERDMTRTLEQFHQGQIHLRVLSSYHDADAYWRESVLELDGSNRPVEFGAIKIHLDRFAEPWRGEILAEHRPLGGLLNASGRRYTSRPTAYLQFTADTFIATVFGIAPQTPLFGRQNALRDETGAVLAEIIEILPPTDPGSTRG